ncbi:MAG: hypothetical protein JG774_381 [Desulfomicrobiaceae bacterium]|jgi:hypothetical protein|nr:hypothetical protein [Desulfomicrobiaceae bacterium]
MEEKQQRTDERRHGLAALFDEYELKDLFRKYVHLLLVVEGLIFLVCWVYQLGLDEAAATGHPVDIPFPWKTYFVVALSAPVAVTFLVGIVVAGFNAFVYGHQGRPLVRAKKEDGTEARLAAAINFCMQLPFLLILGMLGILIGVLYNLGSILEFLGRFGEAASRIILIGLGAVLAAGTIYAVVRLILQYKLRAKNMEYEYKRQVMEQLGIAIVDNTVVHKSGTILPPGSIDVTPQLPQGSSQPPGDAPRPGAGDAAP